VPGTGTSFATPHVAGVVALMLERNPALAPQEVQTILQHTARPLPYGRFTCGAGLLDAHAAVLHA
jgi:serine protease